LEVIEYGMSYSLSFDTSIPATGLGQKGMGMSIREKTNANFAGHVGWLAGTEVQA
jgi:hypothetical protein